MKLFFSPPSPFARKARAVIIEKNLQGRVELVQVNPMEDPAALLTANPLGKIPALLLGDGTSLYDSPVICEYLDSLTPTPVLTASGAARIGQQRRLALIDGLLDAAVAVRMEALRPESARHAPWVERQTRAVRRALAALEGEAEAGALARPDMAHLGAAIALEYLDLRLPDLGWRGAHPALAGWLAGVCERPSLEQTRPPR